MEPPSVDHSDRPATTAEPTGTAEPTETPVPDPHHPEATATARLDRELVQAQKMDALGQLVPGIAHELNNPLAAIIAFSQLIRRDARLPGDLRHDADLLVGEAETIRRIVQHLLEFARPRPPERHPTQLRPLVQSVVDLQSYLIAAAEVTVEIDIADDVPPVHLDRALMQQALLNLMLNASQALRATRRGGRLAIRATADRSATPAVVHLVVAHDGPGGADAQHERPFARSPEASHEAGAAGRGLAVAHAIVAQHGGSLRHEPADGGGATFVVELPFAVPNAETAQPAAPRHEEPRGRTPTGDRAAGDEPGRPRVLVVEDDSPIGRFLAKALTLVGCEPVVAETGGEAVDLVRREAFDAVLCDHRMPGMSGTEVFEAAVRVRPELANRFVITTGDVLDPALREFAEMHGIGLLAKPFDLDSVGRTVRAVVERPSG